MKKVFYTVILNMIAIGLIGCKYKCHGYDLNDKSVISFRLDDNVVYVSNNNDTLKFVVDDFYADGPFSFRGLYMDVECRPECYYKMTSLSNPQMTIKEAQTWNLEISFCEDQPYKNVIHGVNEDFRYEDLGNFPIDTITYYGVVKVYDLSGQRRIDSFMKAIEHGIIEFHDKQTDLTWTQIKN
jgi:hypothetical protein